MKIEQRTELGPPTCEMSCSFALILCRSYFCFCICPWTTLQSQISNEVFKKSKQIIKHGSTPQIAKIVRDFERIYVYLQTYPSLTLQKENKSFFLSNRTSRIHGLANTRLVECKTKNKIWTDKRMWRSADFSACHLSACTKSMQLYLCYSGGNDSALSWWYSWHRNGLCSMMACYVLLLLQASSQSI